MQRFAHPGSKRQVRGVLARNEAVHAAKAGAHPRGAAGQAGYSVAGPEAPHAAVVDAPLGHAASDEEREYRTLMRKWWFRGRGRRLHDDLLLSLAVPVSPVPPPPRRRSA